MLACVTSVASSLLFLSPVLMMVGFVLYARFRHRGDEDLTVTSVERPELEALVS
jgi:hypothetical protein